MGDEFLIDSFPPTWPLTSIWDNENAGVENERVECESWRGRGLRDKNTRVGIIRKRPPNIRRSAMLNAKRIKACILRYDNGAYSCKQFLTAWLLTQRHCD